MFIRFAPIGWVATRCAIAAAMVAASPAPAAAQAARAAAPAAISYAMLDPLFVDFQRTSHIPGLVYGIVADGRLVHVGTFGVQDVKTKRPVTAATLFRIASMTKAFTALSILSLRDAGRLSLDAPAERYVPELRGWRYPTSDAPRIRVRDLLHHSAGFVTDDPWADRQTPMSDADFSALLRQGVPFNRTPGLEMEYSNFGYALLGRVVANVSGDSYRGYVERTLLTPLGMRSSGFEVDEAPRERRAIGYRWQDDGWREEPTLHDGAFGAIGGLQTSADDYARYIAWLLSAWPARDGPDAGPLSRATVRELVQGANFPQQRNREVDGRSCAMAIAYGMGVRVIADCDLGTALTHAGGFPGYGSGMLLLPDYGVGLFVFGNRTYAGGTETLFQAASMLRKTGMLRAAAVPGSGALARAHDAVRLIFRRGDVLAARRALADNFLLDHAAADWRRDLAALRRQVGECRGVAPLEAKGALSGTFHWSCERGQVDGQLLLAPTTPATIQYLRVTAAE